MKTTIVCTESIQNTMVIKHLVRNGQPRTGHTESRDFKNDNVAGKMFLETSSHIVPTKARQRLERRSG